MSATPNSARRAYWLKTMHQWHWISSAVCLLGILLFSVTGITLNHAEQIDTEAKVTNRAATLPLPLQIELQQAAKKIGDGKAPLPESIRHWLADSWSLRVSDEPAEWSPIDVYLGQPRPGGDAWLRIGLSDGQMEYELTDRGWISWLNDLHKGRHTGAVWYWFIDLLAVACLFFSATGLVILQLHAKSRPSTWAVVGLGVLVPVLIALLFIH
jgi:hypothetical protein